VTTRCKQLGIFERIKEWYIQELQNNLQRKVEQANIEWKLQEQQEEMQ